MATNPYVNKVVYDGSTLIDLSNDTLSSANQLLQGVVAHDRTGATVTGTIEDGDEIGYGSTGETWYFNSVIDFTGLEREQTYSIDFVSYNKEYTEFLVSVSAMLSSFSYDSDIAYVNMIGWYNESYRTITITGGADKDNATFRAWLTANATKQ